MNQFLKPIGNFYMLKFAGYLHLHIWEHFLSASYSTIGRMSILCPLEIGKTVISFSKYSSTVRDYIAIAIPQIGNPPNWHTGSQPKTTEVHSIFFLIPLLASCLSFFFFFFQVETLFCLRSNYCQGTFFFFITRREFFAPKLFS